MIICHSKRSEDELLSEAKTLGSRAQPKNVDVTEILLRFTPLDDNN